MTNNRNPNHNRVDDRLPPRPSVNFIIAESLSMGQGLFYLATGIWPLISMRTFEQVTGPKTDKWLVKTAGLLITAIGSALTVAGARRRVGAET